MTDQADTLYCANHPDTPTSLRCNRCEKPICPKCSVLTPTGYRCKDCVRGQQKTFETAAWYDVLLAFGIGAALSFLGSLVVDRLGWFVFFLAPLAGALIAEVIRFAVRKRRSRRLFQLATAGIIAGCLPLLAVQLVGLLSGLGGGLFSLLWLGLYAVTTASSAYYRLAGINL
jgi:hypothetical protein